jgi:hypothetical protein
MLKRPNNCDSCPIALVCDGTVKNETLACNKVWINLTQWFEESFIKKENMIFHNLRKQMEGVIMSAESRRDCMGNLRDFEEGQQDIAENVLKIINT